MSWKLRICSIAALIQTVGLVATAQTPIPGKYYEYYTVARTGSGFTDLGSGGGPSINDVGEVAFRGITASGTSLWFGTGAAAPINFNPGETLSPTSGSIQPSVQINANHQVVSEDRIATSPSATTAIRLYNAKVTDSFIYAARGGPSSKTGSGAFNSLPTRCLQIRASTRTAMWYSPPSITTASCRSRRLRYLAAGNNHAGRAFDSFRKIPSP